MCLAVPVKVLEVDANGMATCRMGEGDTTINVSVVLLPEEPRPGDFLIVHAGFALRSLDPAEAEETLKLLRDMVALVDEDNKQVTENSTCTE